MAQIETVVDVICDQRDRFPLFVAIGIVMGLLLGFSLLYLEPGTAAYAIALVDVGLVAVTVVGFGGGFWLCTKRSVEE
ncbi:MULTISPECIES: hypothetical protein [Haloferax]|uniref:Uncharacterized protein n=1 Tax=Haloferax massiliensis TaxID=1476858 RepID=A0A0D6JL81_9EURY|nr:MULTISPECIES: hypothetical protein [Haloferax]MDS0242764.1 hypothetical protein [Haloferax sp. S2CR25]MDS0445885.1 hypothetical protein [Haloferax sp. S2CR25-2]CQR48644.1 hypothetical protein BN996_00091 [Haloferax massiliensis]